MAPKPTCTCGVCRKCRHREYMRRYYNSLSPEDRHAKFVAGRDAERVRRADRERYHRRKEDPEYMAKRNARSELNDAIQRGDIKRGECEVCGAPDAHGHHDDYTRPLEVRWLCPPHHADEHRTAA